MNSVERFPAKSLVQFSNEEPILVRIVIPIHLRVLAGISGEIQLDVPPPVTTNSILTALEARYPNLRGTLRDHGALKRRPMIRFYALQEDLSHDPPDTPLPEKIANGQEIFYVIAAIAGG